MRRSFLSALFVLAACCAPAAYAQNQIVTDGGDGPSDGECVVDCTLREAVALVGAGGTITFDPAFTGEVVITLTEGELVLERDLTITGPADDAHVTVSGGDASRAFTVNSGVTATITGLTITNGNVGGGDGGGIANAGTLTLTDCTVSNNDAGGGAGIFSMGTLTLTRCTVSGNDATGTGGGLYVAGETDIRNSTISGNTAQQGSGVVLDAAGPLRIDNTTISGNTPAIPVFGNAVMLEAGTATIRNSTLVGDMTRILTVRTATLHISNTIVYQSNPGSGDPCHVVDGSVLGSHSNNLMFGNPSSSCEPEFTSDPNLQPLADNGGPTWTHLPGPLSEAVDNGDPATCAALPGGNFDQRGLPRSVDLDDGTYPDFDAGDPCDIGAVEAQSLAELPVELSSFTATRDGAAVLLRWTTASETNNAGFEIQRVSNPEIRNPKSEILNWETLAFVAGAGTSAETQTYTYRAEGLAPGPHVFRLKQVDYDGAFEYSPEVEVTAALATAFALSPVYPNPFNPQAAFTLTVARAQHVVVTVYDALGREVARLHEGVLEAQQSYTFRLEGARLPAGTYQVRAVGESFVATQPAVLLK